MVDDLHRFGLFNTGKDVIGDYTLNTIAIVMAMLSALCWLFVKPDANSLVDEHDDEDAGLLASEHVSKKNNNNFIIRISFILLYLLGLFDKVPFIRVNVFMES